MSTPSAADILDRELANSKRQGIVTAAAVIVAIAGALDLIGALQLWSVIWLYGVYKYVPWALLALGVGFLFFASRMAAIVVVSLGTLGTGAWAYITASDGFLSLLGVLMPLGSLAAAILAGMAWGPCARTAEARKPAAPAGFDLNLS
jgi:hypothetical protein